MADLTLFNAGTADFATGSTGVVGHGTSWSALIAGDIIRGPDSAFYEITPAGDTNLTLNRPYVGSNVNGAAGGIDFTIFRLSLSRDSVRTATKQLTDVAATYRQIAKLTSVDQTLNLNRATVTDRAGTVLKTGGIETFQAGIFESQRYSVRYLKNGSWRESFSVHPTTGAFVVNAPFALGSIISPTALTATAHNYAPPEIEDAAMLRISANAARSITGLTGGIPGRVLTIFNVSAYMLRLEEENANSAAANRFGFNSPLEIVPQGFVILIYDGVSNRWRSMSSSAQGVLDAAFAYSDARLNEAKTYADGKSAATLQSARQHAIAMAIALG